MTHRSGDLCATKECYDLAHPGHDHCNACIADRQVEREITSQKAAAATAENEARTIDADEVVA